MAISEFAKKYHEKMFPDHVSAFSETDPEFLIKIIYQCLPYIGYPRSLNALGLGASIKLQRTNRNGLEQE